jgi:hypothetical protein
MPLRRTPTQTGSTGLKRRTTQTDLHQVSLESQPTEPQQGQAKRVKGSSHRNGTGTTADFDSLAHSPSKQQITAFADRNRSRSLSANCGKEQEFRSWGMTSTDTSISALLEEALQEPTIGDTGSFRWHATAIGIAALWIDASPPFHSTI